MTIYFSCDIIYRIMRKTVTETVAENESAERIRDGESLMMSSFCVNITPELQAEMLCAD